MTAPQQLTPGMVLGGDFEIESMLELGGMGAVYVASQQSTGKRRAVKVMHPQLVADPRLRERFEQEARVGALIASSHVVEVIAAGVDEANDVPWIAMELLEGDNLADYAHRHGCFDAEGLRDVLRQIGHALGAAHRAGIVHRDIKPENVFVAKTHAVGAALSVKVLDFGIAKVAAEAMTAATSNVGSPAWMAPEQTDPAAKITPATDTWALGLMAFWLLTGRAFWKAAADPNASMHALMREILFADIPAASERAAALDVDDRLPDGFDDWFARCVNRDVSQRFADADAVLDAFEQILSPSTPRTVVHTSIPPGSRAPQSFAHGATMPLTGPVDDVPVSEPFMLAAAVTGDDPPVSPVGMETVVSPTAGAMVAEAAPMAERRPMTTTSRRRQMAGIAAAVVALGGVAWMANRTSERPEVEVATSPPASATVKNQAPVREEPAPRETAPERPVVEVPAPELRASSVPEVRPTSSAREATIPPRAAIPAARPSASATVRQPFDFAATNRRLEAAAGRVAVVCKGRKGDKGFTVTVTWLPSGVVSMVQTGGGTRAFQESRFCAKSSFYGLRVQPFEGKSVQLSVGVHIQ